ncbi:MAG: hypothetical protein UEY11_10540, partial [Evtepia gabavorous]|uniref:hypothetical protein n=1 Tax=Evtepia gabavorous TaxID=2211183 RepID=UPI002E78ACB1
GGSLPPFCNRFEPQKNGKLFELTPMGVFFLAVAPLLMRKRSLCQQTHNDSKFASPTLKKEPFFQKSKPSLGCHYLVAT